MTPAEHPGTSDRALSHLARPYQARTQFHLRPADHQAGAEREESTDVEH